MRILIYILAIAITAIVCLILVNELLNQLAYMQAETLEELEQRY